MQVQDFKLRKELKIANVVCTADLKQQVDIASFNEYEHLHSDLALYRCGYVKDDNMVGRVTVFGNGKLISVGTKSPQNARNELKNACRILKKYKLIKSFKVVPNVRNIVANCNFGKPLHIEKLAYTIPGCIYEPEQFPGLIHSMQGSVVCLLFASGKVVIVGSKTIEELNTAYFDLEKII